MTITVSDGFALPDGVDWPKRGRKVGQRNPNSAAKDAAIQRAKAMVASGVNVATATEDIEQEYYGLAVDSSACRKRRLKYLATLLK